MVVVAELVSRILPVCSCVRAYLAGLVAYPLDHAAVVQVPALDLAWKNIDMLGPAEVRGPGPASPVEGSATAWNADAEAAGTS